MNLNEAAGLLLMTRERVRGIIQDGMMLEGRAEALRIAAKPVGRDFEIDEADLDAFIAGLEAAEPGRNPPVGVRRQLLCEARECCCICGEPGPLEFHHLVDWARSRHHDPTHMMVVCSNCHGKCTNGIVDYPRQRYYKAHPRALEGPFTSRVPDLTIGWDDLRDVVSQIHRELKGDSVDDDLRHDFTYLEIDKKNSLNRLSDESFDVWRREYEPRFGLIKRFLADDRNADIQGLYYEVVGDLRAEVARIQGEEPDLTFDQVARRVFSAAFVALNNGTLVSRETLRALVAFMYFECEIGRK